MKSKTQDQNDFFMGKALAQAKKALLCGEVPVGAIIVGPDNTIIARGYNCIEKKGCQTGHAEIQAIKKACKKLSTWRLNGCWIYVTLEPCLMCLGLISLSRVEGVVFGASAKLFGSGLSDSKNLPQYASDLFIEGGIKAEESIDLLQMFFKNVRKKRRETGEAESNIYRKNKSNTSQKKGGPKQTTLAANTRKTR